MWLTRAHSLRFRLIGLGLLINLLIVGMISLVTLDAVHEVARNDLGKQLGTLDRQASAALTRPAAEHDLNTLYWQVEHFSHYPDVVYLAVRDRDGRVLAGGGWAPGKLAPEPDRVDRFWLFAPRDQVFHHRLELQVGGQTVGEVVYGLSMADARDALSRAMGWCALVGLFSVVTLFGLQWLLGAWLMRPLRRLGRAARAIADGQYDVTMPEPGHDEIGQLTDHFQHMRDALRQQIGEIQSQKNMLHAIADYAYAWELWINPAGKLFWTSTASERVIGYTREECMAMPSVLETIAHDEDRARLRHALDHAIEARTSGQGFEFRACHQRGHWLWLTVNWHPIYNTLGGYQGCRLSVMDSSESKHNQLALDKAFADLQALQQLSEVHLRQAERERARLKALFSALSIGMVFTDRTHRIIYANPMFSRLLSLPAPDALLGEDLSQLTPALFVMPEHSVHGEEEAPRNELKLDDKRVLAFQHIDVHDDEHGSLWIFEDVTAERATAEQLIFLAERDTLTGVYNRRRFDTELERMVKRADRREQPMALVIFDLNDFKIINDSHGHAAGDQVLIDIARTVKKTVRQNEVFCRLGGDEFAVLMPEASAYDASMLSRRIEQQVTALDFEFDGVKRRVSASLGIAVYPSHANDAQTLVAAADAAMYQAKKQDKRGCWVVFDSSMKLDASQLLHTHDYPNQPQRLEPTVFADTGHDDAQPSMIDELFG